MPRTASKPPGKADLLRSVPLFAELSTAELNKLARLMDEVDVKEGTVVIREGNTGGEFFIIIEGEVAIRRGSRKLGTLGAGDFFGEIALLRDVPRTATVTALEPSLLYTVERDDFLAAVTGHAPTSAGAGAVVTARLEQLRAI